MSEIKILQVEASTSNLISLVEGSVPAGFPSPGEDYLERKLDLHELLVPHPASTFFIRVEGESMKDSGIESGDLLVVDRSRTAHKGNIVVALVNGEFTVKKLAYEEGKPLLMPQNPLYKKISAEFEIWGVVTYVIHKCR